MKIIIARETEITLGIRRNSGFGKGTQDVAIFFITFQLFCYTELNTFNNYPQFCFAKFVNIHILKETFEFFCVLLCVVTYSHMYV